MKYRLTKEIAEELFQEQPDTAHLYALEKMTTGQNPQMWRDVLAILDRLTNEGEKKCTD